MRQIFLLFFYVGQRCPAHRQQPRPGGYFVENTNADIVDPFHEGMWQRIVQLVWVQGDVLRVAIIEVHFSGHVWWEKPRCSNVFKADRHRVFKERKRLIIIWLFLNVRMETILGVAVYSVINKKWNARSVLPVSK